MTAFPVKFKSELNFLQALKFKFNFPSPKQFNLATCNFTLMKYEIYSMWASYQKTQHSNVSRTF